MNRTDVRIAVLAPEGRDRGLIRDLVAAEGWEPVVPPDDLEPAGPWRDVDVIVVDAAWLDRCHEGISRTRRGAGSEFVPVLLISPRDLPPESLPDICDQVLTYPTTRAEFVARLRGLIRARVESRRVYRSFFENALIGVYRATWSGEILMANEALARMLGDDVVASLKARDARIPDLVSDSPLKQRLRETDRAESVEGRWTTVDGEVVHVVQGARRMDGADSLEDSLVEGTVENVTELAHSRERLARSERFLQSAIDALSAHVAILDPDGNIIGVNEAWKRFEGDTRPPGTTDVGVNYLDVCSAADEAAATEVARGIRAVIDGDRRVFETEYPCHSPTERRWFRMIVTAFPEDPPRRTVVAHENITEIKVAQKRFELLVEGSSELTILVNPQGQITYCSTSTDRFLGRSDVEGRTLVEFVHPADRATIEAALTEPESDATVESRIRREDGVWRDLEWTVSDMRRDSIVRGLVLHGRDVTDRKAMLGELQTREKEVRQMQKMEAIGMLAGGVAHDFNNLLTTIQGNIGLLRGDVGERLDEGATDHLDEIGRAAEQGAFLTQRLLMFSRKEPDQEPTVEDMNEVLGGLGRMLERLVVETIDMKLELSDHVLPIRVRSGEVEQVVVNLTINAAQAMPDGGELVIRSRLERVDDEDVMPPESRRLPPEPRRLSPGDYAILEVVDTGHGMSPEVQERIFEPFFTTKPRGEGTGLGLATVFGIVSRAGGFIEVYSEPGLGSRFAVHLPLSGDPGVRVDPPVAPKREDIRGRETLLLVEDEDPVRKTARRGLERLEYTVLEARNGVEALEVLESAEGEDVVLIVSDFVMPEMSGLELARAVNERRPGLPILITSGYPDADLDLPPELPFDTLSKPYALADLGQKVRKMIGESEEK